VWVVSGVAAPRTILLEMGNLQRGDVVLVNRWTYAIRRPRPGDVALYALPRMRVPFNALYGMRGQAAQYQIEGEQIDRVVAAPGQRVVIQQGTLLVDGREAVDRPLDHVQWPSRLDLLVPPGHFFVVPSALRLNWDSISDADRNKILFVPEDLLLGKAYLRNYPLWRSSWIH
jgi:signal peptidase I